MVANLEKIIAIELMLGARSHEFLLPLKTGSALQPMVDAVSGLLEPVVSDRFFGKEFERVLALISRHSVESVTAKQPLLKQGVVEESKG